MTIAESMAELDFLYREFRDHDGGIDEHREKEAYLTDLQTRLQRLSMRQKPRGKPS